MKGDLLGFRHWVYYAARVVGLDGRVDPPCLEKRGALMSRVCHFTGKKTRSGRTIARRGKAKYLGGVGIKTTGSTKRKFKANIQRVRALLDGKIQRIKVSAKAIRMGLLEKPLARDWKANEPAAAPSAT